MSNRIRPSSSCRLCKRAGTTFSDGLPVLPGSRSSTWLPYPPCSDMSLIRPTACTTYAPREEETPFTSDDVLLGVGSNSVYIAFSNRIIFSISRDTAHRLTEP